MRDLRNVLEMAYGSPECETCPNARRITEHCDVPQHQGTSTYIECSLWVNQGDPNECPVVVGYKVDYEREFAKAKAEIGHYVDPYDEQLGKYLAALLADEDTLDAALTLKAYLLKIAAQVAEENV